eukprot:CAMPEP_0113943562 /NCGR_PEP_ID=MMETSP1339-20121228/26080_1 /TAXON_ID=94617 /ORGANISM="Fibrocapsa japonica" /LENGTH=262 /DNA_ID=CAMNT_0000948465 /DNA_START=50 /DNA_END=838 /DNA_ORIENTATION=+ /assembly_acc=CAM_ASM_000762
MYRNNYDTDVTIWSPDGRLFQVEYAMEAVMQGMACLGMRSDKAVVLAGLKRSNDQLSGHQKKVLKIDNHMGITFAGLTADARSLAKYMRGECLNHRYVYGAPLQAGRLVNELADKLQRCTQSYVRRPYGVGILVASYDPATGPHLYQTDPAGNYYEFYANAIGARSQSAKTYLEKNFESFKDLGDEELIVHALKALSGCLGGSSDDKDKDKELDKASCCVAVVSEGKPFKIIEGDELQPYLDAIEVEGNTEAMEVEGEQATA